MMINNRCSDLRPTTAAVERTTGLPDRDAFVARLDDALAMTQADPTQGLAMLLVDLDRFHRVMARFGEAGSELLVRAVADRICCVMQGEEHVFLARIGPDRFALLFTHNAEQKARASADRIQAAFDSHFDIRGEPIFVTASIAVAYSDDHASANDLVRDADMAIEHLNVSGGRSTLVFRAGMHNSAAFQLLREREVRLAVTRHEFTLHFQPIVDAMRGGLHAFEALLRWRNPEEGLLPPSTFLDILKETGLIDDVGHYVIREACAHAARWRALTGTLVPVTVNVVPAQLYADDFCGEVAGVLAQNGLPGQALIIELTEDALVDDAGKAQRVLERLRQLGVQVFLDDFGTGYSSLSYLHALPVTGLKLDRSFLRDIDHSARKREIVGAIVRLAHAMDMLVVAEGVEQPNQMDVVRDLDCDFAQGFCLARPFDGDHAMRYLMRCFPRGHVA